MASYGYSTVPTPTTVATMGSWLATTMPLWTTGAITPNTVISTIPLWTTEGNIADRSAIVTSAIPAWSTVATGKSGELATHSTDIPFWTTLATELSGEIAKGVNKIPLWTTLASSMGAWSIATNKIPLWRTLATEKSGERGAISTIMPLWETEATLSVKMAIQGYSDIPPWFTQALMRSLALTEVFKGIVVNTSHYAVTEYRDYPFKSFGFLGGRPIGGNSTGIYVLDGKFDDGNGILAEIETGLVDLFKEFIHYAREVWLTGETEESLILVVGLKEGPWETPFNGIVLDTGELRAVIARGIKERYMTLGIKNPGGSYFSFEDCHLMTDAIGRRR